MHDVPLMQELKSLENLVRDLLNLVFVERSPPQQLIQTEVLVGLQNAAFFSFYFNFLNNQDAMVLQLN